MNKKEQHILDKIRGWQKKAEYRITCPHNSAHILVPSFEKGKLVMKCPAEACGYKQHWVPLHFLD